MHQSTRFWWDTVMYKATAKRIGKSLTKISKGGKKWNHFLLFKELFHTLMSIRSHLNSNNRKNCALRPTHTYTCTKSWSRLSIFEPTFVEARSKQVPKLLPLNSWRTVPMPLQYWQRLRLTVSHPSAATAFVVSSQCNLADVQVGAPAAAWAEGAGNRRSAWRRSWKRPSNSTESIRILSQTAS